MTRSCHSALISRRVPLEPNNAWVSCAMQRTFSRQPAAPQYKAFVRQVMHNGVCPLIWIGAPPSYLQRLDHIQRCALRIIGPGALLPSMAIRRTVASLACLYKLHYLPGPPQLLSVLPPRYFPSSSPRTRSEHGSVIGHDHQLQHQLLASVPQAHD